MEHDFVVENHGSLWLLQPLTGAANEWLDDTAPEDAIFYNTALAIEPRYVAGVLQAVDEAGYEVAAGYNV